MKIIIHSTPDSVSSLVEVKDHQYYEQLLVNGKVVTDKLFCIAKLPPTVLTAIKKSTRHFFKDKSGTEITREDLQKRRQELWPEFGVFETYRDDEHFEVSSQPDGVERLNQKMAELYTHASEETAEPSDLIIVENVAKDLGEFITPLTNASGIPEVALYTYNRHALRASYFPKALQIITENKGIISSQYPKEDWSIYFYVVQGDALSSIDAGKNKITNCIGSEENVLNQKAVDVAFYEAKLQDLRAKFAPEGTNKAAKSHLADLVKIQNELGSLEVKSKSYRDWDALRNYFARVLNDIRNEK